MRPTPSRAYEAGSGAAEGLLGLSGVPGSHLPPGSITGGVDLGHSTGKGMHLEKARVGVGTGVGSHLMVLLVGMYVTGVH